jgi:hypothetical protein
MMSAVRVLRALQSSKRSEAQTKAAVFTVVPAELSTNLAVHRRLCSNRDRTTGHINVGRPLQNPVNEPCQNPDIKKTTAQGVLPWRRGWVSWWRYNVGDLAVLDTCVTLDTVLTRVHLDTHECERHERWSPSRPRAGRKAWGESAAL